MRDILPARAMSKQLKKIVAAMLAIIVLLIGCLVATSITGGWCHDWRREDQGDPQPRMRGRHE